MKVFKKFYLLLFFLIAITPSVTHAEESFVFIGKHPHFTQRTIATVLYVGESNVNFEQAIFLEFNEIVIKIFGDSYTNIKVGDQVIGRFNDPDIQDFHIVRTEEYLEGRVICKRIPKHLAMAISKNNTYINGSNNTHSNNKTIKGNNNINRNNVYIAGNNNTITGNTHKQGSNNVYENNIVIGDSNNNISNTDTEGRSNQIVQGQIIDKSSGGSSGSSVGSSYGGSHHSSKRPNYLPPPTPPKPETVFDVLWNELTSHRWLCMWLMVIGFLSPVLIGAWRENMESDLTRKSIILFVVGTGIAFWSIPHLIEFLKALGLDVLGMLFVFFGAYWFCSYIYEKIKK